MVLVYGAGEAGGLALSVTKMPSIFNALLP
jgi:hypothetical protein